MRIPLLIILVAALSTDGAVITAASVERADVLTAINSASHGDTIMIPAGIATWSNSITNSKALTIRGAGIGNTIITNCQSGANDGQGCTFNLTCSDNGRMRLTGITFDGCRTSNIIYIDGSVWSAFRIDNCSFVGSRYRPINATGLLVGLVDNCVFADCTKTVDVYAGTHANLSWTNALTLGTTNTVMTEDCSFVYTNWGYSVTMATTSRGQGSRSAIRNCIWTNQQVASFFPIIDAHGNQLAVTGQVTNEPPGGGGNHRGSRQFEMYYNWFGSVSNQGKEFRLTDLRGGTCVIFSNNFYGFGMNTKFRMREEDGPSEYNFLTNYSGWDPHMLHFWSNNVNGALVATNEFLYAEDPEFIRPTTNLFWTILGSYTPLEYPHPFRRWDAADAAGISNISHSIIGGRRLGL